MTRKISSSTLALTGLLFLAACGSGEPGESPGAADEAALAPGCLGPGTLPMPPKPRILRDVAQVSADGTKPATNAPPSLRTTGDGRIGFNVKTGVAGGGGGSHNMKLFLLSPEKASTAGTLGLIADTFAINLSQLAGVSKQVWTTGIAFPPTVEIRHSTLCAGPKAGIATPQGAYDAYDLTLIGFTDISATQTQSWQVDVHLVVASPRTATAKFLRTQTAGVAPSSVTRVVLGPVLAAPVVLEPMITADGQLLVARMGSATLPGFKNSYNIFYTSSPTPGGLCNVAKYATQFKPAPILYAPHDPHLKDANGVPRYGFAARPMRDPRGHRLVTDAQATTVVNGKLDIPELAGTYPWIDKHGRNLFFYGVGATNSFKSPSVKTRFPTACAPGDCSGNESLDATRGLTALGSWTNGKAVLLDGLINNIDFGYGINAGSQRSLTLYAGGPVVRFASGRDNGVTSLGPAIDNITIADSLENLENGSAAWQPRTRRDVVWKMSRGALSDEVAFDDFIDPNVFLYAPMNGVMDLVKGRYLDGFEQPDPTCAARADGTFLAGAVQVQNAATMPVTMGTIPRFGTVSGNVRIEPAALGGIHGRGLYLPAGSSLRFTLDNAGKPSSGHSWYTGFFIDGATAGPALDFGGRFTVSLAKNLLTITPAGQAPKSVTTTPALLGAGWTHIGLVVEVEAATPSVAVYVNGDFVKTVSWPASALGTLSPSWSGTTLTLNPAQSWVDELKIILDAGWMRSIAEIPCNHARGSMVGPVGAPATCRRAADDGAVTVGGGESSRRSTQLGIVNLHSNLPRPDFTGNAFCASCHVTTASGRDPARLASLTLDALVLDPSVNLDEDDRRQPLVAPRQLSGNIAIGSISSAPDQPAPSSALSCGPSLVSACNLDDYLFP